MNRRFAILAITAILTGCTAIETIEMPQAEIAFQVANCMQQTKANPDTLAFDTNNTFVTNALYTGDATFAEANLSQAVNYMSEVISYAGGVWKAQGKTYCWPKAGNLSFVSYTPSSANLTLTTDKTSLLKKDGFTVDGTDLMIAELAADKNNNENRYFRNGVPTLFHHVLSQVSFSVKADTLMMHGLTFTVTVDELKVKTINTKADLKWNASTNATTFENATSSTDKTIATAKALTTSASSCGAAEIVLPQSLASAKLSVKYTIKTFNGANELASLTETVEINMNTIKDSNNQALSSWESGKRYNYNITLNPLCEDVITFDPAIEDWTDNNTEVVM